MSTAWRGGSTRRWRRTRALVLADNQRTNAGRCTLAIPGICTGGADTVHHVLGRAVTGDDPRWLAAACKADNQHIGEPDQHPAACFCGYGRQDPAAGDPPKPRRVSRW